jgi:tetratricopeptide (TPR) repeat protein
MVPWTKEAVSEALRLFYRAIELDPDFARPYALAAHCYLMRRINGFTTDRVQETAEAEKLAKRAAEFGKDDAGALASAGYVLAYLVHDLDAAVELIDRALLLNPNFALAWCWSGTVRTWLGQPEVALEHLAHAMRLSPVGPLLGATQGGIAFAHLLAGRCDEASSWAQRALRNAPNSMATVRIAAASFALAGRLEEAQKAVGLVLSTYPTLRVCHLKDLIPFRRPEDLARYEEALRKAGLPE